MKLLKDCVLGFIYGVGFTLILFFLSVAFFRAGLMTQG